MLNRRGRRAQPDHLAHGFVARNDAGFARLEVALGQVQVSAAHAADPDPEQDLALPGVGIRAVGRHEGPAGDRSRLFNPPGSHGGLLLCGPLWFFAAVVPLRSAAVSG